MSKLVKIKKNIQKRNNMDKVSKTSYKCVSDSGSIIPFVPRADSVEQEHYHFEKATQKEVKEWKKQYRKTKVCNHPCGHDETCFYMYKAVCDICGESDVF